MNLELLKSLEIDANADLETIKEKLEDKQIELLRRLEGSSDEERRKTLEKSLKQIEDEIEDTKKELKILKSALVEDDEPEKAPSKLKDKLSDKKAEKDAKKKAEKEAKEQEEEKKKAKDVLEEKAQEIKEKAEAKKKAKEEEQRIKDELKQTLFGDAGSNSTQPVGTTGTSTPPATGGGTTGTVQTTGLTGNTAATTGTTTPATGTNKIPGSAAQNSSNEFSEALREYKNKNYSKAFPMLKKLAEGGDATAQYLVSQMYRNGYGVGKDEERWEFWIRKAADKGEISAQFDYGKYLLANISKKASNEGDGLHYLGLAASQKATTDTDKDTMKEAMKSYIDAVNAGRGSLKHVKKAVNFCNQLKTLTVDSYDKQQVENYADTLKTTIKKARTEEWQKLLPTIFTTIGALSLVVSYCYMFAELYPEVWQSVGGFDYLPAVSEGLLVPIDAYWEQCSAFSGVNGMFGLQMLFVAQFFKTAGKSPNRAKFASVINAVSNAACGAMLLWGGSMVMQDIMLVVNAPAYLSMFFISVLAGMVGGNVTKVGLHI